MNDLEWGWIAGFSVLFAIGLLVLLGIVLSLSARSIATNCDKAGRVVINGEAYTCERINITKESE